jgi:hypothetical protein
MIERVKYADLSTLNGRRFIYQDSVRMVEDFMPFGSGAETFAPL